MIEKIKNITKIGLVCVVLLSFIGGSIAVAEQTTSEPKNNTVVTQNKTLNHPINPVHLLPGQIITPGGRIVNKSDFMNMPIIKSGNIKLQNASIHGMARINAIHDIGRSLFNTSNASHDEVLSVTCNATDECSYNVIKLIKTSSNTILEPSTYHHWVEDEVYNHETNSIFSAQWTVPTSPANKSGQLIYLFPAMQSYANSTYTYILQPVLQWGYNGGFGGDYWTLASWYGIGLPEMNASNNISAYEGDHISGVIQKDAYNEGYWNIDTYDMTQDTFTSNTVFSPDPYTDNFIALEVYDVNNCDQFPGATDFTNLVVDNTTPSWKPEQRQTGCGLSVNRISSSEVILNTGGPLVNWNYSKIETINGTTAGAQTNYQMKLTLYNNTDTDTPGNVHLGGNVRSDFGDIRFTGSDGTLLDYWIESYLPGISAVVWVKVNSIPANPDTTYIYLYYGNPSATSASSGKATFAFFDDFEDGDYTYNPTWSVEAGTFSVQNETLDSKTSKRLYSSSQGSRINSTSTLAQNTAWEWDYYNQGRDSYGNALQQGGNHFIYLDANNYAYAGAYSGYIFQVVIGGASVVRSDSGSNTIATGILHYKVTRSGNTWTFYVNDIQKYQGTISGLTSSALTKYLVSASGGSSASYPNRIDNLRYRNYISPEPIWGPPGPIW